MKVKAQFGHGRNPQETIDNIEADVNGRRKSHLQIKAFQMTIIQVQKKQ
jgi:hypothetical protein